MYIISAVALLLAGANAFSTHGATAAHSRVFRGRQMQLSTVERKSVCIVGGGFGGLYSALSIAKKMDAQTDVYLIDPKDSFVFLPLLYELAVGTASSVEVAPRYESLLQGSKIKFIKAAVDSVDFEGKVCKLRGVQGEVPESLKFDQLVVSVGIQPRTDLIPGAKDRSLTLPFYTVTDAFDLKKKLKALKASKKEDISVAVIGGGYSGVEVATNVAQSLGDRVKVTIIDRNNMVMQSSPEHNRRVAEK
jgi:NADH:ubiquinone reductase (non-electrogenic)